MTMATDVDDMDETCSGCSRTDAAWCPAWAVYLCEQCSRVRAEREFGLGGRPPA